MASHLVTVEVSVECCTDERVEANRVTFDELRIEGLDTQAVKRRSAVQHDRVVFNNLFENVPNFRTFCVNVLLSRLERVDNAFFFQALDDERLVKFKSHALRETALVHAKFRSHDNHGTAGVVNTLTEQVHTEAALLTLEEFSEALERTCRTCTSGAAAAIEQLVDSFLEHTLFVAENHVRGTDVNQLFQAVVAVDDTAIEFVQVGGSKAATFERYERTKIRRDNRKNVEDHPGRLVSEQASFVRILVAEFFVGVGKHKVGVLGFVVYLEFGNSFGKTLEPGLACVAGRIRILVVAAEAFHLGLLEGFDDLEALHGVVLLGLGLGSSLQAEFFGELGQVDAVEQLLDSRCAHLGFKFTAFGNEVLILSFVDQGVRFEVGRTRINHHVLFVVDDMVEVLSIEVEECTDDARLVTDEPGVGQRDSKFDVAHAFATDLGVSHFNAATVADDALVADALELTAVAFPVLNRSKDLFAEKTILFRLEGTVVNRFRLCHFAIGPVTDQVRGGEMNRNVAKLFSHFFSHNYLSPVVSISRPKE